MKVDNLEFKARLRRPVGVSAQKFANAGYQVTELRQVDTFLNVPEGYLKIRETEGRLPTVIRYNRARQAAQRVSNVVLEEISEDSLAAFNLLREATEPVVAIKKNRLRLTRPGVILNIDSIDGLGNFIECEVELDQHTEEDAAIISKQIMRDAGVRAYDLIPSTYAELHASKTHAETLKRELRIEDRLGHVLLLDGGSATGKSTVRDYVARTRTDQVSYSRRVTTREPRRNEQGFEQEYISVSPETFAQDALRGQYLEFRDFAFGMSYALPFSELHRGLHSTPATLGLMNLGNASVVDVVWPEATTIMILSSAEVVERRLRARGGLREEQIEERVLNVVRAADFAAGYDYVIENDDLPLETFLGKVDAIVDKHVLSAV